MNTGQSLAKRNQAEVKYAWRQWTTLILKVAMLETKGNLIKKLLEKYEATERVIYRNGTIFY